MCTLLLGVLAGFVTSAYAQGPPTVRVSLREAVQMALRLNPQVQIPPRLSVRSGLR